MGTISKYFPSAVTAVTLIFGAQWCVFANATTSDDLYSESIYIQKSSAEIPGSLESSGRKDNDSALAAEAKGSDVAETITAIKTTKAKKIGNRRGVKKSARN